jgi:Tfp pilus assembly protein PilN
MSQQINLLNPALIKKTDLLKPNNIALLLGVLLLALLAYYVFAKYALEKTILMRSQTAERLTKTQTQVNNLIAERNTHVSNQVLLNRIKELEQKEIMQQAILKAVSQNSATPSHSYAALLRAFSKQSIDGLWITGLSIDQDAEALSISGRTLNADLLPTFIARLRAEPALKGKSFTQLTMQAAAASSTTALPNAQRAQAEQAQTATSLTNGNTQISINQVASNTASASPAAPKFIEFTLRSSTETKENAANANAAQNSNLAGGSQ